MRTMLLPGLLETARAQSRRSARSGSHIFEVGKVFLPVGERCCPMSRPRVGDPRRRRSWDEDSWLRIGPPIDYYLAKGLVERISAGLHAPLTFAGPMPTRGRRSPSCIPARAPCVSTGGGHVVGWMGEVHPAGGCRPTICKGTVVAAELDLGALLAASADVLMFRDLLAYPGRGAGPGSGASTRPCPRRTVVASLRAAGGELLEDVRRLRRLRRRPGGRRQEEPGSAPELPRAGPHSERGRGQRAARADARQGRAPTLGARAPRLDEPRLQRAAAMHACMFA